MYEAESKQFPFEKSTLLANTIADAKALKTRLASKSHEVATLLNQHRACEAKSKRLSNDLREANLFRERIFATVSHIGPITSPQMEIPASMTNILSPLTRKPQALVSEE